MRDPNCLFCKIVAKEIPADVVVDDGQVLAFRDVNPQAPIHVLVIPTEHLASLAELTSEHASLLASLVGVANRVAEQEGATGGFRVVTNIGPDAGQSVNHLHLHVLAGRRMAWPPG